MASSAAITSVRSSVIGQSFRLFFACGARTGGAAGFVGFVKFILLSVNKSISHILQRHFKGDLFGPLAFAKANRRHPILRVIIGQVMIH